MCFIYFCIFYKQLERSNEKYSCNPPKLRAKWVCDRFFNLDIFSFLSLFYYSFVYCKQYQRNILT